MIFFFGIKKGTASPNVNIKKHAMKLMLTAPVTKAECTIDYTDRIMLIGSCFTEHIGNYLANAKFNVLLNPNGILFDTKTVSHVLTSCIHNKPIEAHELFYYNELWQHWQYHTQYSGIHKQDVLLQLNTLQSQAHEYIRAATVLIITLGSAYSYVLNATTPKDYATATHVANCHKAPQQWFTKELLGIADQVALLDNCLYQLKQLNPNCKVIFTISPVRHIRDGLVENNRSKARLIEVVHHLTSKFTGLYYYPAYELVIDVLRDYRFYDIDLVHPNYLATSYVMDQFVTTYMQPQTMAIIEKVKAIVRAANHKPTHQSTQAHKAFVSQHIALIHALQALMPTISLQKELAYFEHNIRY